MRPLLFFAIAATLATPARPAPLPLAAPVHLASGPARVALVELYTSEGCSSCPPAERWLGQLRDAPGLWRDFVPVAFHVDYWNRLGWPDPFSSRVFTERQTALVATWPHDQVYTPCFVRDGAEWRPAGAAPARPAASAGPAGHLTATFDGAVLRADYNPATGAAADFEVHAALLGAGIVRRITAGENRGETLRHDFVALALVHGAPGQPIALAAAPTQAATVTRHALAVWVTLRGEITPRQAAGGWLD